MSYDTGHAGPNYIFEYCQDESGWTCQPTSQHAFDWLKSKVPEEGALWLGTTLIIEHRDVEALAVSLEEDGWSTEL
jgi:hypothetical protein